jgi:Cd2+/Zn2+-exporting ATPase
MEEISGHGVRGGGGWKRNTGRKQAVDEDSIIFSIIRKKSGTIAHIAVDRQYAGYILIADEIKEDARKAIRELKEAGIRQTYMLTGDNEAAAMKTAGDLQLDHAYANLLPEIR